MPSHTLGFHLSSGPKAGLRLPTGSFPATSHCGIQKISHASSLSLTMVGHCGKDLGARVWEGQSSLCF